MSAHHHEAVPASEIACAVLTASDTRTPNTDQGGALLCRLLREAGHPVPLYRVVPDEPAAIRAAMAEAEADAEVRVVLITGGTGIAPRDRTFETVEGLLQRPLPGFGELFRMLSYREVGPAAMLTRAVAGIRGRRALFSLPGSPAAVELALRELVLPELGHLVAQLDGGTSGISPR
ncbi:MAG: MogA/MoaB family molybdenum cofactor biosynthesis protein [Acidobacteriota bacterium]